MQPFSSDITADACCNPHLQLGIALSLSTDTAQQYIEPQTRSVDRMAIQMNRQTLYYDAYGIPPTCRA